MCVSKTSHTSTIFMSKTACSFCCPLAFLSLILNVQLSFCFGWLQYGSFVAILQLLQLQIKVSSKQVLCVQFLYCKLQYLIYFIILQLIILFFITDVCNTLCIDLSHSFPLWVSGFCFLIKCAFLSCPECCDWGTLSFLIFIFLLLFFQFNGFSESSIVRRMCFPRMNTFRSILLGFLQSLVRCFVYT